MGCISFKYSKSFTFLDDTQEQRLLGTKQPPFRITKPNTFHYGVFAWIKSLNLFETQLLKKKLFVGITMNIKNEKIAVL